MQHIDENMMNTQLRELKPFIMIKGSLRAIRQSIRKSLWRCGIWRIR